MLHPGMTFGQFRSDVRVKNKRIYGSAGFSISAGSMGNEDFIGNEGRLNLVLDKHDPDLSEFDRLSLRLQNRSTKILLVGLSLIHQPSPGERGPVPVSFSGGREPVIPNKWTELNFPKECFGIYGRPDGWSRVQRIVIHISLEKTETRISPIRVSFDSLWGEKREIPPGPRLTAEGLRLLADPATGVSDFFRKHDLYTSTDPGSGLYIPPPHSYPVEPASRILDGWIMGQKLTLPINWRASPGGQMEWTHFLNRQHFLRPLVQAWADTGDTEIVKFIDRLLLSWIHDNPPPLNSNGGAGPAWETLSAAWRLREWLWVVGLVWPAPDFSDAAKAVMSRSVWEHATSLLHHQGHPNNWIIVESAALALAGMCFPMFHQAGQWVGTGIERLERECRRQFFSDGVHYEISPLYHAICVSALMEVKQTADKVGIPLPAPFGRPLERSVEYPAALGRPDFTWPAINDSGGIDRDYTAELGQAGVLFDRSDFTWIGSRGLKGKPPSGRFDVFSDAGISIMRSGWSPRSHTLVFRAGPAGATHVHEDALSLDVTAFGRPGLVDPGMSAYAPGAMTDYYRSAMAHNTILIDKGSPRRSSAGFAERTRPAGATLSRKTDGPLEIVTGLCRGRWGSGMIVAEVRRGIIWVRRQYWIVWDLIQGKGVTPVQVSWQFATEKAHIDPQSGNIETRLGNSTSLLLLPLPGEHRPEIEFTVGRASPPLGWISVAGKDRPAAHVNYSLNTDRPVALAWLLIPFDSLDSSEIRAFREDEKQGGTSLTVEWHPGSAEVIRFGPSPGRIGYQKVKSV